MAIRSWIFSPHVHLQTRILPYVHTIQTFNLPTQCQKLNRHETTKRAPDRDTKTGEPLDVTGLRRHYRVSTLVFNCVKKSRTGPIPLSDFLVVLSCRSPLISLCHLAVVSLDFLVPLACRCSVGRYLWLGSVLLRRVFSLPRSTARLFKAAAARSFTFVYRWRAGVLDFDGFARLSFVGGSESSLIGVAVAGGRRGVESECRRGSWHRHCRRAAKKKASGEHHDYVRGCSLGLASEEAAGGEGTLQKSKCAELGRVDK